MEEDSPRFGQSRPITAPGSEIATALSSQTGISPINFTPMHRSIHRAMIKTPNAKPGLFRDVRWHRVITARQIFCRHVSLEKCTSILRNNLPVSRYAPVQEHAPTRQIPPDQHRARASAVPNDTTPAVASTKSGVSAKDTDEEYDVVVIGSGIGGLSAASLLARYGYSVKLFESHYLAKPPPSPPHPPL